MGKTKKLGRECNLCADVAGKPLQKRRDLNPVGSSGKGRG